MNINGVDYESYLAAIAQAQTINTQTTRVQTSKTESDTDSYISSIASADAAIPSGTYGANGLEVGTTENAASGQASASGGAGGVGGGDSSDSDEDTETEVVTINGVTYLQTTTTDENGNTTVTRRQIGTVSADNDGKTARSSSAAQALASL
jgi:hypothetical protein